MTLNGLFLFIILLNNRRSNNLLKYFIYKYQLVI